MIENEVWMCENCVYFNSKDKDHSLKPDFAIIKYLSLIDTDEDKENMRQLFTKIYKRNGACQRFPKKEYVDNQYICGEHKPGNKNEI